MSPIAIKVESLSKRYKIGKLQRHDTLRDRIADARIFKLFKRRNGNNNHSSLITHHSEPADTIWALKDVYFEIKRGEVVGIIGRNGAGKSTLLKILSRITEPTEGYADITGRIASLLEVGTGFHPELTGRENIYLNGSILGMKRAEIVKKFDEMVAFAEVEKFIDTPVKHYSSGMYVRLAFAVAAHLDPEILLVDEVLAVGDLKFQEKCLGKMGEVASQGRTVLFVSHNLGSIQRLCPKAILLEQGSLRSWGTTTDVVTDYLEGLKEPLSSKSNAKTGDGLQLNARILDREGKPTIFWPFDEKIIIEVDVSTREELLDPAVDVTFYTGTGARLFALQSDRLTEKKGRMKGHWRLRFAVENPRITAAEMMVDVGIREGGGDYTKLIRNVGALSSDPSRVPSVALPNCILYPKALLQWERNGD